MKKDVQSIKTIDILLQSLLFVGFALLLNERDMMILDLAAIFIIQLISNVTNSKLTFQHKRKKSRLAYALLSVPYMVLTIIYVRQPLGIGGVNASMHNHFSTEWPIPVNDIAIFGVGMAIAFWYFMICFKEMKIVIRKLR
jgi:putative flippase GtrA